MPGKREQREQQRADADRRNQKAAMSWADCDATWADADCTVIPPAVIVTVAFPADLKVDALGLGGDRNTCLSRACGLTGTFSVVTPQH